MRKHLTLEHVEIHRHILERPQFEIHRFISHLQLTLRHGIIIEPSILLEEAYEVPAL